MRFGRVVGNVVSTIKEPTHDGKKLMLVRFFDGDLNELPNEHIYADAAGAGVGDVVLVSEDGGAAEVEFNLQGNVCVFDGVIVGVVDNIHMNNELNFG